jgi:hypothetical protein
MPSNGKSNGSHLETFARELGSTKGLDPIPPDQYLTFQDKRYPPTIRLWAWHLAHTIRLGKRKAWAVDDAGKELTLQHAAADLGMDGGNIRHAWRQLEIEGRVRKDGRRLRICGDIQTLGAEKEKRSEVCTNTLPLSILNQIPAANRKAVLAQYEREEKAEAKCLAALAAVGRSIFSPRKDSILIHAGCKLNRFERKAKEDSEQEKRLRLIFASAIEPVVPVFIQTLGTVSEQTSEPCLSKLPNDPVQTVSVGASLYSENPEINPRISSSSALPLKVAAEGKAEEEDSQSLYQIFKTGYPSGHFDEGKTRSAFEKKTRDQQCAIIERLKVYTDCERWKSDEGRWIPLASTWLKSYEADPPPAIPKKSAATASGSTKSFVGDVAEVLARRLKTGTL